MDVKRKPTLLRNQIVESEKVTINLGYVDLGHIDLVVRQGFYSNRSDFIRTAIRKEIAALETESKKSIKQSALELGIRRYTRAELEQAEAAGTKLQIKVLGLASIADDVTPALARAAIESVTVLGAFHASDDIKKALADRLA